MRDPNHVIPTYTIDLSLPPCERYTKLATDLSPQMLELRPLFDEVLTPMLPWRRVRRFVELLASLFLRRVYSSEETEELRGIAKASGVELYFLIALNVILDSLLGCTSGGALVTPKERKRRSKNDGASQEVSEGMEDRMMHFRTLDWGMDGLRKVIVILEFVRSQSSEPEKVIARSVSYAGFVGCLTGLRENLSLSLNFRPNHNCPTRSLRWHQLLILFGLRQSIVSILRQVILNASPKTLPEVVSDLSSQRSPPCYLALCDGTNTTIIEKDLLTSRNHHSSSFIIHTNHDIPPPTSDRPSNAEQTPEKTAIIGADGMQTILSESEDRRECMQKKWNAHLKRRARRLDERKAVRENTLVKWVGEYPTTNESTHFSCLMDPKTGTIRWIEAGTGEEGDEVQSGDQHHNLPLLEITGLESW